MLGLRGTNAADVVFCNGIVLLCLQRVAGKRVGQQGDAL